MDVAILDGVRLQKSSGARLQKVSPAIFVGVMLSHGRCSCPCGLQPLSEGLHADRQRGLRLYLRHPRSTSGRLRTDSLSYRGLK